MKVQRLDGCGFSPPPPPPCAHIYMMRGGGGGGREGLRYSPSTGKPGPRQEGLRRLKGLENDVLRSAAASAIRECRFDAVKMGACGLKETKSTNWAAIAGCGSALSQLVNVYQATRARAGGFDEKLVDMARQPGTREAWAAKAMLISWRVVLERSGNGRRNARKGVGGALSTALHSERLLKERANPARKGALCWSTCTAKA